MKYVCTEPDKQSKLIILYSEYPHDSVLLLDIMRSFYGPTFDDGDDEDDADADAGRVGGGR